MNEQNYSYSVWAGLPALLKGKVLRNLTNNLSLLTKVSSLKSWFWFHNFVQVPIYPEAKYSSLMYLTQLKISIDKVATSSSFWHEMLFYFSLFVWTSSTKLWNMAMPNHSLWKSTYFDSRGRDMRHFGWEKWFF